MRENISFGMETKKVLQAFSSIVDGFSFWHKRLTHFSLVNSRQMKSNSLVQNVWDPMSTTSFNVSKYFILFIDDFTMMR